MKVSLSFKISWKKIKLLMINHGYKVLTVSELIRKVGENPNDYKGIISKSVLSYSFIFKEFSEEAILNFVGKKLIIIKNQYDSTRQECREINAFSYYLKQDGWVYLEGKNLKTCPASILGFKIENSIFEFKSVYVVRDFLNNHVNKHYINKKLDLL